MVCEKSTGVLCEDRSIWESICYLAKARMQPEEEREILLHPMHMEALIGAMYLDGGFANAKEFIHKFMLNRHGE